VAAGGEVEGLIMVMLVLKVDRFKRRGSERLRSAN